MACYRLDGDHYETPPALELAPYPRYLQALQSGRAIDAQDVGQDHRTCELDECVYRPQAIRSILDASIRVGGEVIGVLSLQHSGKPRPGMPTKSPSPVNWPISTRRYWPTSSA